MHDVQRIQREKYLSQFGSKLVELQLTNGMTAREITDFLNDNPDYVPTFSGNSQWTVRNVRSWLGKAKEFLSDTAEYDYIDRILEKHDDDEVRNY